MVGLLRGSTVDALRKPDDRGLTNGGRPPVEFVLHGRDKAMDPQEIPSAVAGVASLAFRDVVGAPLPAGGKGRGGWVADQPSRADRSSQHVGLLRGSAGPRCLSTLRPRPRERARMTRG